MFIGSKLQALRELNGYTRKELSDVIGVTQQAVSVVRFDCSKVCVFVVRSAL